MTTMPKSIIVTDDLANQLWYAQAALIHEETEYITGPLTKTSTHPWDDLRGGRTSDDPGDAWYAAISIFQALFLMRWDQDPKPDLAGYLNTPHNPDGHDLMLPSGHKVDPLGSLSGDGVCKALFDLNCPALYIEDL